MCCMDFIIEYYYNGRHERLFELTTYTKKLKFVQIGYLTERSYFRQSFARNGPGLSVNRV